MRKLTPAYIVTSVALVLASTAALAQLQIQRVGPATAPSSATTTASSGATASTPATPGFVSSAAADASFGTTPNTPDAMPRGANTTALVPGVMVGGATTGAGVSANVERGSFTTDTATPPTPLFELTARQGAAREARRRARGEEPRVYGIAPRTDRDLTHQMPDDPIIRY